jgi:hypothetical protein
MGWAGWSPGAPTAPCPRPSLGRGSLRGSVLCCRTPPPASPAEPPWRPECSPAATGMGGVGASPPPPPPPPPVPTPSHRAASTRPHALYYAAGDGIPVAPRSQRPLRPLHESDPPTGRARAAAAAARAAAQPRPCPRRRGSCGGTCSGERCRVTTPFFHTALRCCRGGMAPGCECLGLERARGRVDERRPLRVQLRPSTRRQLGS